MPIKVDQNNSVSSQACVLAAEVDGLIMKIQEGLRLKAKEKQHTYRHARATPYSVHCVSSKQFRSTTGELVKAKCRRTLDNRKGTSAIDLEPHKLLQKLLKEQTLIQEAVKRLQVQERTASCEPVEYESEPSDSELDLNSNVNTCVTKES